MAGELLVFVYRMCQISMVLEDSGSSGGLGGSISTLSDTYNKFTHDIQDPV